MLPLLRRLPPELAHRLTIRALGAGFAPPAPTPDPPSLAIDLWGRHFANPIGLAAGFDKDAEAPDALLHWGFGFVEIGSVTPRPQPGNPRPRLFRLPEHRAVINRMGFNSKGLAAAEARLASRPRSGIVGANLGKNKESADAAADYAAGIRALGPFADYLVINISSPNTPGLRLLQGRDEAAALLQAVNEVMAGLGEPKPPLLVKVSPDLSDADAADLAEIAVDAGIDGLIVANTTIARPPELGERWSREAGGLSGRPLYERSLALLHRFYGLAGDRMTLVGVGGVASGADAYAKILAGASLMQLYTALVYEGPGLVARIKRELADCLARDGFATIADAVGQKGRI